MDDVRDFIRSSARRMRPHLKLFFLEGTFTAGYKDPADFLRDVGLGYTCTFDANRGGYSVGLEASDSRTASAQHN